MSENDYKETLQKLLKCLFNSKKVYFVDDSVVVRKKNSKTVIKRVSI